MVVEKESGRRHRLRARIDARAEVTTKFEHPPRCRTLHLWFDVEAAGVRQLRLTQRGRIA
jgi:hypothetical protein